MSAGALHTEVSALGGLPNWWPAYAEDGPHATEYVAGALFRHKSVHGKKAALALIKAEPDAELFNEALEEIGGMATICGQIGIRPGSRIVAPFDWVLMREDWACLLAAYRLREKVKGGGDWAEALSKALTPWDREVRRLRREGLKIPTNAPWVQARFAELAANGHKGWWLPAARSYPEF